MINFILKKEFEKNDVKNLEKETNNVFKRLEINKLQQQQQQHKNSLQRSSSLTMSRSSDMFFRQKLDTIRSQTSAIRNDTANYHEKLVCYLPSLNQFMFEI